MADQASVNRSESNKGSDQKKDPTGQSMFVNRYNETVFIDRNPSDLEIYFESNADLPENIRKCLSEFAQDIYRQAFNIAWSDIGVVNTSDHAESRFRLANCKAWTEVERSINMSCD